MSASFYQTAGKRNRFTDSVQISNGDDAGIGVGKTGCFPGLPSLRTVRADLPHTALRLVVLPRRGLTGRCLGLFQGVQTLLGKERIWPAMMIPPSTAAFPFSAFA